MRQHRTYWERYGCLSSISSHSSEKQNGTNFCCLKSCSRNSLTLRQGSNQERESGHLCVCPMLLSTDVLNELQLNIYLCFCLCWKGLGLQGFLCLNSLYSTSKPGNGEWMSELVLSNMKYFLILLKWFLLAVFLTGNRVLFLHCKTIEQLLCLCICLHLIEIIKNNS